MNCRQAETWMDTVLDGPASPSLSERPQSLPEEVRAHFDACSSCRGQWQLLSRAEAALRSPRIVPAPAGMLAEFRDRLAAEERHADRRPVNPFTRWLWPMGSVAAAGLAAAFVVSMNIQPQLIDRPEATSLTSRQRTLEDATAKTRRAGTDDAAPKSGQFESEARAKVAFDSISGSNAESAGTAPSDRPELPQLRARGERTSRPAGGEKPAPLQQFGFGVAPEAETAPKDAMKDVAAAAAPQDFAVLHEKSQADIKSFRLERQRYAKKPSETQMASTGNVAQGAPKPLGAQGGVGGGLGGLGSGGFGGGAPATAVPAGPSSLAAKSDMDVRSLRQAGVDHLSQIADLQAEKESEIAADVSPALITALQRPVSLNQRGAESVLTVLGRLSREADIEVQLEGKVSQLALSIQVPVKQLKKDELLAEKARTNSESQVPLWVALQSLAQQGKLQVVPEENRLVLRPLDAKPAKGAPPLSNPQTRRLARPLMTAKEEVRLQIAPASQALGKGALSQQDSAKPAAPNEPRAFLFAAPVQAQNLYFSAYAALPNPDPRVWPSMWGDLPKWLFTLPEERSEKAPAAESN